MAITIHGPQVTYFGTKQELATLHDLRPDTHVIDTETGDNGIFNGGSVIWASEATGRSSYSLNVDGGNANSIYSGTTPIDGGNS